VEPNYRWAVKGLAGEDESKAIINRKEPLTATGRPASGLNVLDKITFLATRRLTGG
jgi:hypothetical protein